MTFTEIGTLIYAAVMVAMVLALLGLVIKGITLREDNSDLERRLGMVEIELVNTRSLVLRQSEKIEHLQRHTAKPPSFPWSDIPNTWQGNKW